jgi:gag-polypeptide of LTR copia-type
MSEDDRESRVRFPLLNDSNFSEWAMCIEVELIERGLWDGVIVVEVDEARKMSAEVTAEKAKGIAKRNTKKMGEARAKMISRVETSQLVHMRERDPMVIWANIAMTHRARGLATRMAKRRNFLTAMKAEGESITAWSNRVKAMAFDLEDVGGTVTDKDLIVILTMGLGTSYDHFVASIDATSAHELTVDNVITHMLNEEARHGGRTTANGGAALSAMSTAAQNHDRKPRRCWRCGKDDHIHPQCRSQTMSGVMGAEMKVTLPRSAGRGGAKMGMEHTAQSSHMHSSWVVSTSRLILFTCKYIFAQGGVLNCRYELAASYITGTIQ